jgi:hypothetical protein
MNKRREKEIKTQIETKKRCKREMKKLEEDHERSEGLL